MVKAEVRVTGLDRAIERLRRIEAAGELAPRAAMREAARLLRAALRDAAPRRTGALQRSIHFREEEGRVRFFALTRAKFVIEGTPPHRIDAHGKALMLPVLGARKAVAAARSGRSVFGGATRSGAPRAGQQVAFFHSVHHPGTKANDFRRPAVRNAGPEVALLMKKYGIQAAKGSLLAEALTGFV